MSIKPKSPFILREDFISPEWCEEIILSLNNNVPNRDMRNKPIKTTKFNALAEMRLLPLIDDLLDEAEEYYDFTAVDTKQFMFEWYAEGYEHITPTSDNSNFLAGKWHKMKDIDFTIIIFLSSSKRSDLRDTDIESFGGELEFINHDLTINHKAGTMVMFPSNHYFLNTVSDVALGNSNMIRIHVTASTPFQYSPNDYPGDRRVWF
jgi:hypothetical protein